MVLEGAEGYLGPRGHFAVPRERVSSHCPEQGERYCRHLEAGDSEHPPAPTCSCWHRGEGASWPGPGRTAGAMALVLSGDFRSRH